MRPLVSSIAAAGVCLLVARAGATSPGGAPPAWKLEWQAPAECPPRERLMDQVDRILGSAGPLRGPFAVRALVTHSGARWHLALAMTTGERTSQRELDAESCTAVTAAAAVIVALTIEAQPSDAGGEISPALEASVDAGPRPPPVDAGLSPLDAEVAPEDPDGGEASPLSFFLAGSALGSVGALPRAALGVGGALGLARGPFQVEAIVGYWPDVSHAIAGDLSRGGTFRSLTAGARGCGVHTWGRIGAGLCGGASFTSVHAEAFGVRTPIAAEGAWPSLRGDALVQVGLSRVLALRATVGGVVPLTRPTFEVEGGGVVYRPSAVGLDLSAGVEVRF